MTKLSVNLNKVALLRNQRDVGYPSVVKAAQTCIRAGADGITVHPRPDERHIRKQDVYDLAKMLTVEFNIEGNPFPDFVQLVRDVRPAQCTLVPDSPDQSTSDHGWDIATNRERLLPVIDQLKTNGIRVSLFMDPVPDHMALAKAVGADRVELYTEPYASAHARGDGIQAIVPYIESAKAAIAAGLEINAGHDLNLDNLGQFCAAVPNLAEVSIGHALIADALEMGLTETVKAYKRVLAVSGLPTAPPPRP